MTAWYIRCTADRVYLQPLADKFARLVLQLLARYAFWVAEGIASTKSSSGAATPSQDGLANPQVRKEKNTPFRVNFLRSPVLYWAAQVIPRK